MFTSCNLLTSVVLAISLFWHSVNNSFDNCHVYYTFIHQSVSFTHTYTKFVVWFWHLTQPYDRFPTNNLWAWILNCLGLGIESKIGMLAIQCKRFSISTRYSKLLCCDTWIIFLTLTKKNDVIHALNFVLISSEKD